ncbi:MULTISPECIES: pilus assembly protein TadG-related protein [unclassified Nocardioides]|uniref:pilus assembly protein TadG-related protein n=1 Tax=unclassified Nocardioides TaxID=2615069 RepID=UPI001885BBBC|nr:MULTISPECIES: pilus assembly protein TadG-related protein [unclassified Nocardioides]
MLLARSHRPRRDEAGQITTGLVIVVIVALVAVAISGVALLSRGVDEKSQAQSAADAAALAGAGALRELLPQLLAMMTSRDDLGGTAGCGFGQDRASTYAQKNDATLTDYCFDLARGEVRASVQMNEAVSDEVDAAVADAVASTGLDLSGCSWNDEDPPEPTPTPTPTPTAGPTGGPSDGPTEDPGPPPPPPDIGTTFSCGPLTARFVIDGETGRLSFVDFELDGLEPRLID